MSRLKQWLTEGKITRKDRRTLSELIMDPEEGTFQLQDGFTVDVEKTRNGIDLIFQKGNDELIVTLTDICDSLGYNFQYEEERDSVVFHIKT